MSYFSLIAEYKPLSPRRLLHGLLVLLCLSLSAPLLHAEELDTKTFSATLAEIEEALKQKQTRLGKLTAMAEQVTVIKGKTKSCVAEFEPDKLKIEILLTSLGDPAKKASAEIRLKRQEVQKKLTEIDQKVATCRVLVLQSEELLNKINEVSKKVLATKLLARGPGVISLIQENWDKPPLWIHATKDFIKKNSGLDILTTQDWLVLLISVTLTIAVGLLIRHYLCNLIKNRQWSDDYTSRFIRAIVATFACFSPHLLASTAAATVFYQATSASDPWPFMSVLAFGLPPYFLFIAIVRLLLSPPKPAPIFLDIMEKYAHLLARRLEVLALLTLLGYLWFATLLSQSLPEPTLLITRAVFASALIINIWWAISILMKLPRLAKIHWLKYVVYFSLSVTLIIEWLGYRNLSLTLIKDIIGFLLAFGLLLLLRRLFRELYDGLDNGLAGWSKKTRQVLGIHPDKAFPGVPWLRLMTTLSLWGGFVFTLLLTGDVSETILLNIHTYLTQGFNIGSLLIIPKKIGVAILAIAVIIILGGWFRHRMESIWLKKTRMDRGAKEAMVTITGYIVVAIAFFVGLGVAGFDFGSLAIIAGALSVGIGFGLQNVVNNFISGLILLFERPIKTGDWIVVGGTEGYVKQIRIRSTQIQTFDSADVIVPNSELISGQVTNWMLHDPRGRARIAVGVAYGTDTQKVKSILESIANKHPSVVTDGSATLPKVLFMGFGESSLDFELRCYVQNVDERLQVTSDLNFAIDTAFRENGIEIPFPQRDIHIRSGQEHLGGKTGKEE